MSFSSDATDSYVDIARSLDDLSKEWHIDPIIRDLHLGKRNDVVDYPIKVNQVVFHIPYLKDLSLFLCWGCLWPKCSNCCKKQGRLPLTIDDLLRISGKIGYTSVSEFIRDETYVASWNNDSETDSSNTQIISTLTMINLKRKGSELEEENGIPIACRFLDEKGSCNIHPDKPGVCWLYPFFSWTQYKHNLISIHASYQLTGDCPGFWLSDSLNNMQDILKEYSMKIYDYNMSINRTIREGFGYIDVNK